MRFGILGDLVDAGLNLLVQVLLGWMRVGFVDKFLLSLLNLLLALVVFV